MNKFSQLAQCFTYLRPELLARMEPQRRTEPLVFNCWFYLSVRLLSDSDAESHVLEALHGDQVRAEDHAQAERVAGVALIVAGRRSSTQRRQSKSGGEKRTSIRLL